VLRAVIDTSVVVAALRSRQGASNALLRFVARRRLAALATPALFLEYEEVLKRSEHHAVHGLDHEEIDRFLAAFASAIEPVTIHIGWRPQLRDPSDEMVLEAAINGHAHAIVTFNTRDFAPAAQQFGISVLIPANALKEIRR
jgi:putative PIN family toxin of toxin-antitoxin system